MARLIALTANLEMYEFSDREYVTGRIFTDCYANGALDLVGFQEFRTGYRSLFERPDLAWVDGYGSSFQDSRGPFEALHCPLAYNSERLVLRASGAAYLSEDGEPGAGWGGVSERSMTWAHLVQEHTEREVLVVNTHLDNGSAIARMMGVSHILAFVGEYTASHPDLPVVLLADANVSIGSPHERWREDIMRAPYERMLAAGFLDAWCATTPPRTERPRTFHHFQGPLCGDDEYGTYDPDWIFVRGFRVGNCTLVDDRYGGDSPSDHFWMKAYLDFP